MALPQYRRSGTLWYVSDGYIWDDLPASYRTEPLRPLECSSRLFIYNPQETAANVVVRFYHTDRAPTALELTVEANSIEKVELAVLPQVPHKQSFWIAVESDIPVLPQARHEDYTFWDPVPDALIAVAPYPGPLEDETVWVYPDCYQGGPQSWYERETLTILNPQPEPVSARIRYLHRGRESGGEEEIKIPAERVAQLDVWERMPHLLGTENGPPVHIVGDYAVRIDASAPVVTQTTRRARWTGRPCVVGARSTMGFPLRGNGHKLWYYPGGAIVDRGVLPQDMNCDVTWNLLFVFNLDEAQETQATVAFHNVDGSHSLSEPLPIPPSKSRLEWMHLEPWLGEHTAADQPFAMVVTAETPVVPEVTCAEFEMWSQVCPGAMSAVNFHPGPLDNERVWWLGIGHAGGADDINTEWEQTYHLFNPGEVPINVTLSFHGLGNGASQLRHPISLQPGAVARVGSSEIAGLPLGKAFTVRAEGDGPFCAQVFGRAFTRGLPYTRSMYSTMGLPMQLTT